MAPQWGPRKKAQFVASRARYRSQHRPDSRYSQRVRCYLLPRVQNSQHRSNSTRRDAPLCASSSLRRYRRLHVRYSGWSADHHFRHLVRPFAMFLSAKLRAASKCATFQSAGFRKLLQAHWHFRHQSTCRHIHGTCRRVQARNSLCCSRPASQRQSVLASGDVPSPRHRLQSRRLKSTGIAVPGSFAKADAN